MKTIRQRLILFVGVFAVTLTALNGGPAPTLPIIDTEEEKQQIEHLDNAPSGIDDELEESEVPVQLPKEIDNEHVNGLILKALQALEGASGSSTESVLRSLVSQLNTGGGLETPSVIEEKIAEELESVNLEEKIQNQTVQNELEQFGYEIFSSVPTTFAPVTEIPVPPDYIIGPGDNVIIQVYGEANLEYKLVVTREGQLLIPDLGPITVSGLEFRSMRELLNSKFEKHFIGKKIAVTMGELQTIRIFVLGDVNLPGTYTISGLSTLTNALMVSGGVKRTGSLRNIQLKRSGKLVSTLDLYDLLLNGDSSGDCRLQPEDVIFVPPVGSTVGVAGEVQRPAIYEVGTNRTVSDLIAIAGGMLPTASIKEIQIERIWGNEYRTLIDLDFTNECDLDTPVQAGDIVRVFPVTEKMDQVVLVTGHAQRPGGYQWQSGMRISDLLPSALHLLPNADLDYALIKREILPERRIEILYANLRAIFGGPFSKADLLLRPRDELFIFDIAQDRSDLLADCIHQLHLQADFQTPEEIITVQGNVQYPGTYPLEVDMKITDIDRTVGALLPETDTSYVAILRELHPDRTLQFFSVNLDEIQKHATTAPPPRLEPRDTLIFFDIHEDRTQILKPVIDKFRQQAEFEKAERVVQILGNVRHPGLYPLEINMTMMDLIRASGGLLQETELRYVVVSRESQPDRYLTLFSVDITDAVRRRRFARVFLKPRDKVFIFHKKKGRQNLLQSELDLLKKQTKYGDLTPTVFVDGSVRFPGLYPYEPGMVISDLMLAAGGLIENSDGLAGEITRYTVNGNEYRVTGHIPIQVDEAISGDIKADLELSPYDHLNLHAKPQWREKIMVHLSGEVVHPGNYPIKIGERLSEVVRRAGGLTKDAYPLGAVFVRESVRQKEQDALDRVIEEYDDLLVKLHLTPAVNNDNKFPANEQKHEIADFIDRLKAAKAVGRVVIDLEGLLDDEITKDVYLEHGDKLHVPSLPKEVSVAGEVYYVGSHWYQEGLGCKDYINLSGGTTLLANKRHIYVVQANGEVISVRNSWYKSTKNLPVTPGAMIYVPMHVDRINKLEITQALVDVVYKIAISAASLNVLNIF